MHRMTPWRKVIGTPAITLGLVALIAVAAVSIIVVADRFGTTSTTTQTNSSTETTTPAVTSEACYESTLPTNSSASGAGSPYSRAVFNITKEFDSWTWTPLSTFSVGSYSFVTANPATTSGVTQLEPQLFFNVTNSQGRVQTTSVTNLGGLNGQVWPPDMSLQQTLFGGNVTIQWLFQCNSQNVFLEITTQ